MSKDIFESQIGTMLRNAEAPVPSGAWAAIQAQIPSAAAPLPKSSFGFGTAMVTGAMVLMGLGIYSETREILTEDIILTQNVSAIEPISVQEKAPNEFNEQVAEVAGFESAEIHADVSEEVRTVDQTGNTQQPSESTPEIHNESHSDIAANVEPAVTINHSSQVDRAAMQPEIVPVTSSIDRQPHSENQSAQAVEKLNVSIKKSASVGYAPFKVSFESMGNASSQLWDFGQYGKSAERKTEVVFTDPGTYTVWLTAFSDAGDQEAKYVTIDVREGSSCYLPNSIKPDGVNRVLKAEGVNLKSFMLTVVNSTGSVVFQSRDIDEPWVFDPSIHGQDGEFYIATVQAVGLDGKDRSIRAQRINIVY